MYMRFILGIILSFSIISCDSDSGYIEFPYYHFGKEVKTRLGSIYFEKGSFQISPQGQKELMVIVRTLSLYERYNHTQRIRIIGYADQSGESGLNLQLGLARAEEVGHALETYGISMTRAKIASYGESRTYQNDKSFRKVEVWLENDPWAFLKNPLFIYIILATLFSFFIGFLTHRLIRYNSKINNRV